MRNPEKVVKVRKGSMVSTKTTDETIKFTLNLKWTSDGLMDGENAELWLMQR